MSSTSGACRALCIFFRRVPVGHGIPPWHSHKPSIVLAQFMDPHLSSFLCPTAGLYVLASIFPRACPGSMPLSCWRLVPSRGARRALWVGWLQGLERLVA